MRVLVIEDDRKVASFIQSGLEQEGHAVDVKLARLDGELLNLQPEYEHVAAAAKALGRPAKDVLQQAVAAARNRVTDP